MLCCGCHDAFNEVEGPTHAYMLSSPGCWAAYGKLLAREYSDSAYRRVHRFTVDAYALQHPGVDTPQARNSVGVHFSRLALILGRGWPMERANDAMLLISGKKRHYPWLEPPAERGSLSVKHVLAACSAEAHCKAVDEWTESVWLSWRAHHPAVYDWLKGVPL